MGKFLAVTIIVIAIAAAIPVVRHTWQAPADVSTHGHLIDEQMADTMIEAGVSFLASQILLAIFIWQFSKPSTDGKLKTFPGGAKGLVGAAIILVGVEVLALGAFGTKAWATVYFHLAGFARAFPAFRLPATARELKQGLQCLSAPLTERSNKAGRCQEVSSYTPALTL